MKKTSAALLAGLALLTSGALPAFADDGLVSILFGRNYNDGVSAVKIVHRPNHVGESLPQAVQYSTPARVRQAQAMIMNDPSLLAALERRDISPYNVAWVQTALNGGKIIYYY
ncbi:hypothetical protein ACO34A_02385 [Rhizobium sp. ACO-34A]|nr:hypothetical protein [Rhizobium sp. ACO-34A]ATN32651.1 hypothetical protein ACO34A_02385 [Rhizobium sp. ACO-34A]